METNKNIEQLLEMIDHPEDYSEQEILDIINSDDETRETYRQLVRACQAGRQRRMTDRPVDTDAAWRQFELSHFVQSKRHSIWLKVAALFLGIALMSGLTWAAIHVLRKATFKTSEQTEVITTPASQGEIPVTNPIDNDSTQVTDEAIVFDNVPLDEMLNEIAAYYGVTVEFHNKEAQRLRFHFVWHQNDGLDKVLEDMGHFERVSIHQSAGHLIIQ